ncbi:AMP-binding protein [Ruminococcaceae bacterium OttesenSCG-928-I18]|nr:AMP-binding protein [Ruminococcaceae bacterium OttesenSCG-928-I18]
MKEPRDDFMRQNPLCAWVAYKIGRPPTRKNILQHQLDALNRTLLSAQRNSEFYRQWYAEFSGRALLPRTDDGLLQMQSLEQLCLLPTMDEALLRTQGQAMLCTSQKEIHRIVTLQTSGTTQNPKRLCFTQKDIQSTVDFFEYGLQNLAPAGARACILFSAKRPDSVGDILLQSFHRIAIPAFAAPLEETVEKNWAFFLENRCSVLLGHPVQILALGRYGKSQGGSLPAMHGILVSGEPVSDKMKARLESLWHCPVIRHYGLTETAYGGAVSCGAEGQHIREIDLLFEILEPKTQAPVKDGSYGEIVISTLDREAMPVLRYRTGDRGRLLPSPCTCGCALRRLADRVERLGDTQGHPLPPQVIQGQLDELLFDQPQITNYRCSVSKKQRKLTLQIQHVSPIESEPMQRKLRCLPAFADYEIEIQTTPFTQMLNNVKRSLEWVD